MGFHLKSERAVNIWHNIISLEFNAVFVEDNFIFFFGGFQKFSCDMTGSFIYCLNLIRKEWTTVNIKYIFLGRI